MRIGPSWSRQTLRSWERPPSFAGRLLCLLIRTRRTSAGAHHNKQNFLPSCLLPCQEDDSPASAEMTRGRGITGLFLFFPLTGDAQCGACEKEHCDGARQAVSEGAGPQEECRRHRRAQAQNPRSPGAASVTLHDGVERAAGEGHAPATGAEHNAQEDAHREEQRPRQGGPPPSPSRR